MEKSELDVDLEELENRLDRLRALYQQYFLGIEKIEPTIARKDVDRRIWSLRRQQIRNTGKRFKLNQLVQRYNTFQQYWTRICREIENGTYRRHLLKAQRKLGDDELLTFAARRRGSRRRRSVEEEAEEEAAAKAEEATQSLQDELAAGLAAELDPLDDIRRAMDDALGTTGPPPTDEQSPFARAHIPRAPPMPAAGSGISPFDLELDDGPETPRRPESPPVGGGAAKPMKATPTMIEQVAHADAAPTPAKPAAPPPAAGGRPLPAPRSRLTQAKPPAEAQQKPAAAGTPPRPAAPAAKKPGASGSTLSDDHVRRLHAKLVRAKQSTGDKGTVTEEGLARSLRAAETKLRQKHGGGRQVDFDIVIKNGKAVVKPIVR